MIGIGDPRTTIVAIASGTSPAVRGAVRISGDDAVALFKKLLANPIEVSPRPSRVSVLLQLNEPLGVVEGTALIWPTSRSYTGCPSVEIHTYGALPILEAIVSAAIKAGARPAGPGEFTMRAFLAGRLDLTQAEAVLGVIDATDRKQLDAALTQLAGNLSAPLHEARYRLLDLLADVEAGLDFVEEDISFIDNETLCDGLRPILTLIEKTAEKLQRHHRSEAFHWVVLRGLPNAGKSSLLNALVKQSVAIVSKHAGTTRDVVWKELKIADYAIRLADTAGIESGDEDVVTLSQKAAADIHDAASIIIHCCDAQTLTDVEGVPWENPHRNRTVIRVATKGDQIDTARSSQLTQSGWIITSSITGAGLADFCEAIKRQLATSPDESDVGVPGTAARCADAIEQARRSLEAALSLIETNSGQEFVAAEMRQALSAIGEVTGAIYTDDILDRVFSRFCIGK
jgi:tRNA modification GTPase